ncbi:hypothetical protein J32TS6_08830 [Virgibacillus pantothenticus]|uniref:Uncharacterized protein n=1 Tax=Virgibacillus pantothenticus TaxID=1473 RepID=A0A0L0QMW4_VIRPA|nr:hypothetical protein [Virgibacillus pantothenticus]KNE19960.1 hypothetical protein AFK71_16260 [Virgibacillus pantothenticus]MBU8564974.1 hypothetical protein [Virgibacillus pantothenticus]MBU8599282.1 hypothetical protein [Virgibacillus pantothenticus]MBU8633315.1 hypothetical protein [Virgibacillus pantothenticus]MBU8645047.1 hypothetical protein [Virgibacillus pantothenticus]
MVAEIKHKREAVDGVLKKMDQLRTTVENLGLILGRLANEIQANFAGEAKESVVTLLNDEVKNIKKESENWQALYEQAEFVANKFEEQDEKIIH